MRWATSSPSNACAALTDAELLAVVLGDGDGGACSLQVAQDLLEEVDGLAGLQGVPSQALQRQGIDETQAAALVAALDLAAASPALILAKASCRI